MDWARDHQGNLVPAWAGGTIGFGLNCPTCGEPVRRRSGLERRPHFAHFSHRAKPDCENYFPSSGLLRSKVGTSVESMLRPNSITFGILLTYAADTRSFDLLLRVPPLPDALTARGEIEIRSGIGSKRYRAGDLNKARLVPLLPRVPLGNCSASGDLLPLASHLSRELESFGRGLNLFYCGERTERLLASKEPLEWGTKYRVLSCEQVVVPGPLSGKLEWQELGTLGRMWLYEISLPSVVSDSRGDSRSSFSEFLGRPIRAARPRAFPVWPLPHHYDLDGSYVYSSPPDPLLIRRTKPDQVSVTVAGRQTTGIIARTVSDEWVSVEGLGTAAGEVVFLINDTEEALLRVGDCELFRPPGLRVHCGLNEWDPLLMAPIPESELASNELIVDCHSARLADDIVRGNSGWYCEDVHLRSPAGQSKYLEAGGFGRIGCFVSSTQPRTEVVSSEDPRSQTNDGLRVWIEGIARTKFGSYGAIKVREYLRNPTADKLREIAQFVTSDLMPYVRAATARGR